MQIVIRENNETLKIDSVSIGVNSGGVVASPLGSSANNSIATWSGTTGTTLHSDRTVTLTSAVFTVPSTVVTLFQGSGTNSTRIGTGTATGATSLSLGFGTAAGASSSIALGDSASVDVTCSDGLALGRSATLTGLGPAIAFGSASSAQDRGISLGPAATTLNAGLAIGGASHAENFSIAIGTSATTSTFTNSVVIGESSAATGNNQLQLGTALKPLQINAYAGIGVWGQSPPGTQPTAIPDASGGTTQDTEARAAINALLAAIRQTGIIDT